MGLRNWILGEKEEKAFWSHATFAKSGNKAAPMKNRQNLAAL